MPMGSVSKQNCSKRFRFKEKVEKHLFNQLLQVRNNRNNVMKKRDTRRETNLVHNYYIIIIIIIIT